MFKVIHTKKRYLVIVCLIAVLLIVALLAVSCGDKGTSTGDVSNGEEVSIDGYIQELDGDMNSVDPNDFSDSELDDSELGI